MDPHHDHTSSTHEREVIVTDGGRRSASPIVAIVALIVFGILGYLLIGAFSDGDAEVDVPAVDVNVDEALAPAPAQR